MMKTIRYYLYRLKWKFAPYINFKSPVHVDLELNNNCNQKCVMCWHYEGAKFEICQMSKVFAKTCLFDARQSGVKSIKFNLRGEPLIYKHFNEVVEYGKKCSFVDLMINTNGVFLNESIFESGITSCTVSLDAFEYKNYKKIHNDSEENHTKVKQSLILLSSVGHSDKIKINVHVNRFNGKDVAVEWDAFLCIPVIKKHTMPRKGEDISVDKKDIGINRFSRLGVYFSKNQKSQIKKASKRKKICPHIMRRLTTHANGDVYLCCMSYDEQDDLKLGSIVDSTYKEIWNGKKRKDFIKNYKAGNYCESCKNCTSNEIYKG